ncbi:MAG: hypothetical protein NHB32_07320 [Fischerella sp. CENA71]|nr:hypothetical protein [Fischerella sp. CENA71]
MNDKFTQGYALLIGVGESAYSKLSLPVTVKDTQAIYAALIDPELCAYPDHQEHIRVLNNQEATRQGKGRVVFTSSEGEQKSWIKDESNSIYTYHFLEALQGAANKPGDTEVKVSNLMNHLSKAVPETASRLHNAEQIPHFDMDAGDFVIAKLRGGKGLPSKGWEEVQLQAIQKINKIADTINQYGKFITNINEVRDVQNFHIGDVINKN